MKKQTTYKREENYSPVVLYCVKCPLLEAEIVPPIAFYVSDGESLCIEHFEELRDRRKEK